MNLKTNLEKWIQYDTNPLIIFSNDAKVLYLNEAGEYILSFISPKRVYDTIIQYAPQELGFKYIKETFTFGEFSYDYALIGYDNYDEIGVRFYKDLHSKTKTIDLEKLEEINIYFILDLARTYTFIDKEIEFIDIFDPDLPDIKFNKDILIKLFNEIYSLLRNNNKIKTEVKIKIGEYIKLNNQKYKLLEIILYAKNIEKKELEYENITIEFLDERVVILLPFIV